MLEERTLQQDVSSWSIGHIEMGKGTRKARITLEARVARGEEQGDGHMERTKGSLSKQWTTEPAACTRPFAGRAQKLLGEYFSLLGPGSSTWLRQLGQQVLP